MWDLVIDMDDPAQKEHYINLIRESTGKRLIYSEHIGNRRSDQLNKYYWVVLQYIEDHTGWNMAYSHQYFKQYHIPKVVWRVYGNLTTTTLTTRQMMGYIAWIKAEMWDKFRLKIPGPTQFVRP